jgi:pimeloyl-ACP methyl ester carboxylesterase
VEGAPLKAMRVSLLLPASVCTLVLAEVVAAAEWEAVLDRALASDSSQTRHDGLKQVDTSQVKGLHALWKVLAIRDPNKVDWFVREGAYEALLGAEGEEADKEINRVLKGAEDELAREAIVYAVTWKIRKEVIKEYGQNNDRKIAEVKYQLRKKRGVDYFAMVLPVTRRIDPDKKYLGRIQLALKDKSTRVRRAAIIALMADPDESSVPLLIENLKKNEKQKAAIYREWVLNRFALEVLTGQNYRDQVEDWQKWWEVTQSKFSLKKRVEEEAGKAAASNKSNTVVRRENDVEVKLEMKITGNGYPLLVLPIQDHEVDYLRPYFHGVEEFCRVYYMRIPQIDDYSGLPRDTKFNLPTYPTDLLAKTVTGYTEETGLKKFAILGHGPESCQLAMMLAASSHGRVSHLVLINPRASGESYWEAMQNVRRLGQKLGNPEMVKGIDNATLIENGEVKYKPSDDAEAGGMARAVENVRYADATEPESGAIDYYYEIPRSTQVQADKKWSAKAIFQGKKISFATYIFLGEKDPWTPVSDMMKVSGVLKPCTVVKFPNSSEFPFLSETYQFTKEMEKIFRGLSRPAKKTADKEASAKKTTSAKQSEKSKDAKDSKDAGDSKDP